MRRLTIRATVALLTFTIGVAAAAFWFFFHQPSSNETEVIKSGYAPTTAKQAKVIVGGTGGEAIRQDGQVVSFTYHDYSDGTSVRQESWFCESAERATSELQKRLKDAVEVVRREPVLDENGRQIGERVVATFPANDNSSGVSAWVLWTKGPKYFEQRWSSLEAAVSDFESWR